MATIPIISLIPSGYKAGKVYSVLPTDGSADFNFSRNTTATRINKEGLLENIGVNIPRLDYEGGGCPSLLLEPQRTNLLTYSEGFSNAYWSKFGTNFTVTDNNSISPSGELNASTLNVSNADNELYKALSFGSTSGVWTFSIYAKGSGTFDMKIRLAGSAATSQTMTLTSDWQRFDVTSIYGTSKTSVESFIALNNIVNIDIFGAQTEQKSYPTSYIPTSGSAQTRLAETANGAGNASTFNDSEGVLMVDISKLANISGAYQLGISNGSDNENIKILYLNTDTVRLESKMTSGSNFVFDISVNDLDFNKFAVQYKANDYKVFYNGLKQTVSQVANTPIGLNKLSFDRGDGASDFYGKTRGIQYYNTALTDLELEKITSYTSFNAMALAQNYKI